jgi:hypothetical protein
MEIKRKRGRPAASELIRDFASCLIQNFLHASDLSPAQLEGKLNIGDQDSHRKGESVRSYILKKRSFSIGRAIKITELSFKKPFEFGDLHLIDLLLQAYPPEKFSNTEFVDLLRCAPRENGDQALMLSLIKKFGLNRLAPDEIWDIVNIGQWHSPLSPLIARAEIFPDPHDPLNSFNCFDGNDADQFSDAELALHSIRSALKPAILLAKTLNNIWSDVEFLMRAGIPIKPSSLRKKIERSPDLKAWYLLQFLINFELELESALVTEAPSTRTSFSPRPY